MNHLTSIYQRLQSNIREETKYVQYHRIVISCELYTNLYHAYIYFCKGDFCLEYKQSFSTLQNHPNAGDPSGAHGYHTTSNTTYYVTFQVESGERIELSVSGSEYGKLSEGDERKLTFQGTRYLQFNMDN